MPRVHPNFRLTDFRLAGFLVSRGATVISTGVNARREVEFVFAPEAEVLVMTYPGSPEQHYDASCRAMHDMVRMTLRQAR